MHDSLRNYLAQKDYRSITVRLALLLLQGAVLLAAAVGIYTAFAAGGAAWLPLLILVYFTGHISFDPVPRYAIPAMPYVFIFTAVGLLKLIEAAKGGNAWKA